MSSHCPEDAEVKSALGETRDPWQALAGFYQPQRLLSVLKNNSYEELSSRITFRRRRRKVRAVMLKKSQSARVSVIV